MLNVRDCTNLTRGSARTSALRSIPNPEADPLQRPAIARVSFNFVFRQGSEIYGEIIVLYNFSDIFGFCVSLALWVFYIGQKDGAMLTKVLPGRQTHFLEVF